MADYNKDEEERMAKFKADEFNNPTHYTNGLEIQPLDYIIGNQMDFLEGNIIKYVTRYPQKGGINDLYKARVYINKLIEREEKNA